MSKLLTLRPRVSEKAYDKSQNSGVYVFEVPSSANKHIVAEAIKAQFDVTVTSVNILNTKGKAVTRYQKRGGRVKGNKLNIKKAYVTLKSGDEIAIFPKEEDQKDAQPVDAKSKKATRRRS
jgi:large subunit ribosomal protein L23